jgi:hypothetical protein
LSRRERVKLVCASFEQLCASKRTLWLRLAYRHWGQRLFLARQRAKCLSRLARRRVVSDCYAALRVWRSAVANALASVERIRVRKRKWATSLRLLATTALTHAFSEVTNYCPPPSVFQVRYYD